MKQKYINVKTNYQTPRLEEFEDTKGILGTTQWPKEKVQKDKQRSTKHTHKKKIE